MASACSSSISVQKSTGAHSSGCSNRRKSCETICSSNSSCFLQKKKPINPLAASVRSCTTRSDSRNIVRQRVMSARMIKLRNLQSQLNDANYHLMELAKENRALKTLQKRQDKALNNYEGVNADLPRLIKCHEEENRVLTEKNRAMKKSLRELTDQLKIKDDELNAVKDQLKHITNLSKDKHLGEREKLKDLLDEARVEIKNNESEISLLNRRLMLEIKNSKQKMNAEITKHKRCQRELVHCLGELERVGEVMKEKKLPKRRFANANQRQSISMINMINNNNDYKLNESTESELKEEQFSDSSSDVKLEPITTRSDSVESKSPNTMQSPAEKIKARLSAKMSKSVDINEVNDIMEKLKLEEENLKRQMVIPSVRPKPNTKLDTIRRSSLDKSKTELKSEEVIESPKLSETNKEDIKINKDNEDDKKSDDDKVEILLDDNDFEMVNKIWDDEYEFKKAQDIKINKNEPKVALENKKKLLAALRDIDNGKSIDENNKEDSIENTELKKSKLIRELFG